MTDSQSWVDTDELVRDLRLATAYAARAGLLRDEQVLGKLDLASQSRGDGHVGLDPQALTAAFNQVAVRIAPITIADLRCKGDPCSPANRITAQRLQVRLAMLALAMLSLIGQFMHSLRGEQAGLQALQQREAVRVQPAVTTLRQMAQLEPPFAPRCEPERQCLPRQSRRIGRPESPSLSGHLESGDRGEHPLVALDRLVQPTGVPQEAIVDASEDDGLARTTNRAVSACRRPFARCRSTACRTLASV